jgi:hypothetical protein
LQVHDRVIAVVSAFKNQTDALEAGHAPSASPRPDALAFYLGMGEMLVAGEPPGTAGHGIARPSACPGGAVSPRIAARGRTRRGLQTGVRRARGSSRGGVSGYVGRGRTGSPMSSARRIRPHRHFLAAGDADRCLLLKDAPDIRMGPGARGHAPPLSPDRRDDAIRLARVCSGRSMEYARSRAVTVE